MLLLLLPERLSRALLGLVQVRAPAQAALLLRRAVGELEHREGPLVEHLAHAVDRVLAHVAKRQLARAAQLAEPLSEPVHGHLLAEPLYRSSQPFSQTLNAKFSLFSLFLKSFSSLLSSLCLFSYHSKL